MTIEANRPSKPPYTRVIVAASVAFVAEALLFGFLLVATLRAGEAEWRESTRRIATMARNSIETELDEFRSGRLSRDAALQAIRVKIRGMTYQDQYGDNYIFMGSYSGIMLVQPFDRSLEDRQMLEARDADGFPYIRALIEAARAHPSGSFVKYRYLPPGRATPEPKLSYVIAIPEFDALLGTGLFLGPAIRRVNGIVAFGSVAALAALVLVLVPVGLSLRAYERANRLLREDIEARLAVEASLRSSRKDLATVLESISDAILVHDIEGRVFHSNRAARELFGAAERGLEGISIEDLSAEAPDLKERIRKLIAENAGEGAPRFDWKSRRLDDGRGIDVDVSLRRVEWEGRSAVVAVIRDAGPRRRAAEYSAWLSAIFRNVPLPFWAIDAEGRFVLQSAASAERFGSLVGRRLEDVMGLIRTPIERIETAAAGGTFVGERLESDGEAPRSLIEILAPVPGMGDGAGILCIEIDISDRVRAEEESRRLNRELERRVEERTAALLEYEKLAAIGRLAAGIAHELNTPLGAVLSSAETLSVELEGLVAALPERLEGLDAPAREALASLLSEGESPPDLGRAERALRAAVADRLEASGQPDPYGAADDLIVLGIADPADRRIAVLAGRDAAEAVARAASVVGALRLVAVIRDAAGRAARTVSALRSYFFHDPADALREIDLAKQIDGILTLFRNDTKNGVEVVRRFEGDPVVLGHTEYLSQIWMNLVKNALQAMGYAGRLEVGLRDFGGEVEVYVGDSGPGIPEEARSRVFEPFFTTKKPGEGTGLGLDICRKNAELHGGRVRFESEPGRTVFIVRLPRRPPESRHADAGE